MIRAPMGEIDYWNKWIGFMEHAIAEKFTMLAAPSVNPTFDPQFSFSLSKYHLDLILMRYSRGDKINELSKHFPGLLSAWEKSNELSQEICAKHGIKTCRNWVFDLKNLNHYNWCFWLVGLALTLNVPDDQWLRLLALVGDAGQDELLDRVIATRQPGRQIGVKILHKGPYARLLKAIDAPKDEQARYLHEFVSHWYDELARKGEKELWWYIYGDPAKNPLEMGNYFGRWCIEAAVAAKVFGLNDTLCLGHAHYPGDLLRPDGPSTHSTDRHEPEKNWLKRLIAIKP